MSYQIDSSEERSSRPGHVREATWVQAELVQGVQDLVNRVPYSFRGLIRLTYTVTSEGRMTNVRADVYEEPHDCETMRFRFIKPKLEAQIAMYFEGCRLLKAQAIGRRQISIPVNKPIH